jgi:hypothetical protein
MRLAAAAEKGRDIALEQILLGQLHFSAIDTRYLQISDAHRHTFEWVLQPSSVTQIEVDFTQWLCSENNLFWVSGKPGAGKSTLMKYLCNHHLTFRYLNRWAGKNELVTANFFFWNPANDRLQKSLEGVLRSLLYQFLSKFPTYIRLVLQDVWISPELIDGRFHEAFWLLKALQRAVDSLDGGRFKFVFFLDGLDEYESKPADVVRLINILKSSRNIKMCISSRPWNEFEEAFGRDNPWKLRIHETTRSDITSYVQDPLGNNKSYQTLLRYDSRCPGLVTAIVNASQGVFLWVFLVVRSLLGGLTNDDRIVDLIRRLNELPTDLEEYFDCIITSVNPFYRQQTA